MPRWLRDFGAYWKAVLTEGSRKAFAMVDLLGLVVIFLPDIATSLESNVVLYRLLGLGILLVSFALANFDLYRKSHQDDQLVQLRPLETSISSVNWLGVSEEDSSLCITDEMRVTFEIKFECVNPLNLPVSVKLTIDSVESDWQTSADLADIKLDTSGVYGKWDGRLRFEHLESREQSLRFAIPFTSPDDRTDFGYLGSVAQMIVVFAIEQPNQPRWHLRIVFDSASIRRKAKGSLLKQTVERIQHRMRQQRGGQIPAQELEKLLSEMLDIVDRIGSA